VRKIKTFYTRIRLWDEFCRTMEAIVAARWTGATRPKFITATEKPVRLTKGYVAYINLV
jgi:hypothetical protein